MQLVGVDNLAVKVALPLCLRDLHERAQSAAGPHQGLQVREALALHALGLGQHVLQLLEGRGQRLRERELPEGGAPVHLRLRRLHRLGHEAQHLGRGAALRVLAAPAPRVGLEGKLALLHEAAHLLIAREVVRLVLQDLGSVVKAPESLQRLGEAHGGLLLQKLRALAEPRHFRSFRGAARSASARPSTPAAAADRAARHPQNCP
mmetsp:Transcript_137299/g.333629  ORF Transcript_137299/g.333629 Transcript_137299/m.333629 type:complete len:205 (-) Transcript_137299:1077-1691(-)